METLVKLTGPSSGPKDVSRGSRLSSSTLLRKVCSAVIPWLFHIFVGLLDKSVDVRAASRHGTLLKYSNLLYRVDQGSVKLGPAPLVIVEAPGPAYDILLVGFDPCQYTRNGSRSALLRESVSKAMAKFLFRQVRLFQEVNIQGQLLYKIAGTIRMAKKTCPWSMLPLPAPQVRISVESKGHGGICTTPRKRKLGFDALRRRRVEGRIKLWARTSTLVRDDSIMSLIFIAGFSANRRTPSTTSSDWMVIQRLDGDPATGGNWVCYAV